jgi:hypothetical protein
MPTIRKCTIYELFCKLLIAANENTRVGTLILATNFLQLIQNRCTIDLILPAALGPGVYSASNRNEYQELIK